MKDELITKLAKKGWEVTLVELDTSKAQTYQDRYPVILTLSRCSMINGVPMEMEAVAEIKIENFVMPTEIAVETMSGTLQMISTEDIEIIDKIADSIG